MHPYLHLAFGASPPVHRFSADSQVHTEYYKGRNLTVSYRRVGLNETRLASRVEHLELSFPVALIGHLQRLAAREHWRTLNVIRDVGYIALRIAGVAQ